MIRLAINGYGRVGRCIVRALYESAYRTRMQVVAINEPADLATIVHLTKYDTTHGRFNEQVESVDRGMSINNDYIAVSHHLQLNDVDWSAQNIDVVLECSGNYATLGMLQMHREAGAKKVLLSQPGEAAIKAFVYGINQHLLRADDVIVSAASCTSNCITPVIDVLHNALVIESGIITTIHSAMNDQPVLDAYHHTDLRKTRASGQSIIPVDTGLAVGISRVLPALEGKFSARALRVPTLNVSAMELTVCVNQAMSTDGVNAILQQAADNELKGILGYSNEPLASCDFNHDSRSGIVDAGQTQVCGNVVSVLVWFDNEWAYANRMLDIVNDWLKNSF
ncbi:MAG: erythrose-4-phosphate dehydrogenase [Spongiibacteraceae bacterium]|nr:erythrose-4-phosphate dehydrogenase [Spongiibacteraceae bacterium]